MIIWLIGLAGSGKSTLAESLKTELSKHNSKVCIVDGDSVREANGNDLGYTIEDRKTNARRIQGLCKLLEKQGFDVIVPILSNFQEDRDWNRENFNHYFEVFVDTPIDILKKRNQKSLYSDFDEGKVKNVVGLDIKFNTPKNPDLVVNGSEKLDEIINKIKNSLHLKTIYNFDLLDQRIDRSIYMYPEYFGKQFIQSYMENRRNFLDNTKPIDAPINIATITESQFSNFDFTKKITELESDNQLQRNFIIRVCRNFEVNKKLYFDHENGDSSTDAQELTTEFYILTSYIISRYLKNKVENNILSTFLKLNDFILYLIANDDVFDASENKKVLISSFSMILTQEVSIINTIINEKIR